MTSQSYTLIDPAGNQAQYTVYGADLGNDVALNMYATLLHSERWALYRVRRIFPAKATADRAVEVLTVYENEDAAIGGLRAIAASLGGAIEMSRGPIPNKIQAADIPPGPAVDTFQKRKMRRSARPCIGPPEQRR